MNFFIGCPLGQEKELLIELKEVFPLFKKENQNSPPPIFKLVLQDQGGIEIETDLIYGLQLNYFLKFANRILLRLLKGPAHSFKELELQLRKLKLDQYQIKNWNLNISASKSKMNNEKRIYLEFERIFPKQIDPQSLNTLFVRMFQNELTISLDLTGELLHKRTLTEKKDLAPLRESLAYLGLRTLKGNIPWSKLNQVTLLDPMAGSGTLLKEGFLALQPHLERQFTFEKNYYFKQKVLSVRQQLEKEKYPFVFKKVIGFEIDPVAFVVLQDNLKAYQTAYPIQLHCKDFHLADANQAQNQPLWIISNPPYGIRVPRHFKIEDLVSDLLTLFKPDRMGLFLPKTDVQKLSKINWKPYTVSSTLRLIHGGIALELIVFIKL